MKKNPNFDEKKFGKYFDKKGQLKMDLFQE